MPGLALVCTGGGLLFLICFFTFLFVEDSDDGSACYSADVHRKRSKWISEQMESFDPRLTTLLKDGKIRLLSAKWLKDQPEGFVLSRRQELEKLPVIAQAPLDVCRCAAHAVLPAVCIGLQDVHAS